MAVSANRFTPSLNPEHDPNPDHKASLQRVLQQEQRESEQRKQQRDYEVALATKHAEVGERPTPPTSASNLKHGEVGERPNPNQQLQP